MKKLLFKISIFIYLSLFTFVSYILTTTVLKDKTNASIMFLVGYYIIFGFAIIGFIHNGMKKIKEKPKFDKIKLTKEKVLKKGAFIIYLLLFAFSSYVLIRMRMNNTPHLFKWFMVYIAVFVIPCWKMLDNHIITLNAKIKFSCFKTPDEFLEYMDIISGYSKNNSKKDDYNTSYNWSDEENYYDRQTREYDEYYAHSLAQKQLDDLGNCHRW